MAFTTPRTWVAGEIVTAALMNTHIRDNERYLKGLDGAITLSDALILPDGAGYYLHIPILTTVQRDGLTPTAGMVIYNSTTTQFQKYENAAWRADLGFNSDHGGLGGLGDDDHTQYQLKSLLTTQGDIIYATAASTWARLAKGTATQQLIMNAGATAPAWASPALTFTELVGNNNHANPTASTWEDWDVSALVPSGGRSVLVLVAPTAYSDLAETVGVRKNGSALARTISVNPIHAHPFTWLTECDTNRIIETYASDIGRWFFNIVGYWT